MDDRRKSILDKLFDCVNNGVEWGVNQVKNPCPPRKKFSQKDKDFSSGADSSEKIDSEVVLESQNRMRIRGPDEDTDSEDKFEEDPDFQKEKQEDSDLRKQIEEDPDFQKKITQDPNNQNKIEEGSSEKEGDPNCRKKNFDKNYSPCPGGRYLTPEQICPQANESPCCVILMQDPCRPYCEPEEEEEPCPPKKGYLDEPREPTCSCDFCKRKVLRKGCVGKEKIFGEDNNSSRLERA